MICADWRRRGMGPLSLDLRKRVISAVTEDGMSCRGRRGGLA